MTFVNDNNDDDTNNLDKEEEDEEDFHIPPINFKNNPKPRKNLPYNGRKIKGWYELTRDDKERIKYAYMQGTIKGFKIFQMEEYIYAVTRIKVERRFIYDIKRKHEADNHAWYYNLARDRFAYIGVYRKCIDEIEVYKEGLWRLIMDPAESGPVKLGAYRELHNLSKTSVLLLKDLPFIMSLSKRYDPNDLDPYRQDIGRLTKNTHSSSDRQLKDLSFLNIETIDSQNHHTNLVFDTKERIESLHTIDDELTKRLRELHKVEQNPEIILPNTEDDNNNNEQSHS